MGKLPTATERLGGGHGKGRISVVAEECCDGAWGRLAGSVWVQRRD